mmetsp:Transcript_36006/g.55956  ORF Transcript_36006/g.55956 Transcript_36006/m.55956 type:complete len:174 (-) Transcript_36006:1337-1858(-)
MLIFDIKFAPEPLRFNVEVGVLVPAALLLVALIAASDDFPSTSREVNVECKGKDEEQRSLLPIEVVNKSGADMACAVKETLVKLLCRDGGNIDGTENLSAFASLFEERAEIAACFSSSEAPAPSVAVDVSGGCSRIQSNPPMLGTCFADSNVFVVCKFEDCGEAVGASPVAAL